jgi:hypothetical protein
MGMAFIRKRTTRRGVISTALVESYRQDGKIRHRLIANLHGAESLVVGRLAAEREAVRKEQAELESSIPHAEEFYQVITTAVRNGHVWSPDERKEIDRLLRDRKRLLKRMTAIDKQLERIQREGTAIKKHCTATADEIRAEANKHAKKLDQGVTMQPMSKPRMMAKFMKTIQS